MPHRVCVSTPKRRYLSPLRYPGGKARMSAHLAEVFAQQHGLLDVEVWMEPFAGGAGAALTLLDEDQVSEAWLVERHPALAAFWRAVVEQGDELAARVEVLHVDMTTWDEARHVVGAVSAGEQLPDLDAGLAAFVVNRCSRSGIVTANAGPMGGKHQRGRWTVASRWNAVALAERIRHVHTLGPRIRITEGDGIEHIAELDGSVGIEDELFLFVDPPYIREGNRLYANGMTGAGHQRLADALRATPARWLLTYDDEPAVHESLYPTERVLAYDISNTANRQRVAREFAVFSDNCALAPDQRLLDRGDVAWIRRTHRTPDAA